MSKFGGGVTVENPETNLLSAGAPNALGAFMDKFTTLTESYWFYDHTEELRYNKEDHVYFRVDPELGNLIELYGVTTVLKIIDKSDALVPWSAKMVVEKLLRLIPLAATKDDFGSFMLAPMTLEDFTKIVMIAKTAPKDKLEDAGNIGHLAHECLEKSIQYAIDHTQGIVLELRDVPTDEKAKACAEAGFAWMRAHNVRWKKTEQKIYSREHQYAGTMDGLATVDSCTDPSCCQKAFKDHLSLIDWKSSNALHIEYLFQTAAYLKAEMEEYGLEILDRWILRLGKNDEEAGKFEPWYAPPKDFPEDFQGFLTCLNLVNLVDSVKARMSTIKKGVKAIRKEQKGIKKELDKAEAKVQKAAAKAQLRLDRTAEKERIKADAKKAREEAKNAKKDLPNPPGKLLVRTEPVNEVPRQAEDTPNVAVAPEVVVEVAPRVPQAAQAVPVHAELPSVTQDSIQSNVFQTDCEEVPVERKRCVIPQED